MLLITSVKIKIIGIIKTSQILVGLGTWFPFYNFKYFKSFNPHKKIVNGKSFLKNKIYRLRVKLELLKH